MKKDQGKRMLLFVCLLALALSIDFIFRNIRSINFFVFVAIAIASVVCLLSLIEAYQASVRKERKIGLAMIVIGVLIFMYTGWLSLASFETLAKANGAPLAFFGLMTYLDSFRSRQI